MNDAKVRAFFREFPFLKQYDYYPGTVYYPCKVLVSRFNPEFLSRNIQMGWPDCDCSGCHGYVEEIRILDRNGKELAQVGRDKVPQLKPLWKSIFSRTRIESWKTVYLYEQVYETLLRLRERGELADVCYALSFFDGTLTLYKLPKGVDLSDWIDWLRTGGKKEGLLSHEKQIRREQALIRAH